jgi:effector-binding domain-containing protein
VASTLHPGPYDAIGGAYLALTSWLRERGHETAGPPREVYIVGPHQATHPGEYRTEVAWPIED